ncbi:hypothetical protein OHC33_002250 [Knufia fluminis]|uniref:Uncharacterized protein n=1 Tax=Knufia fluminis TaxID=191047 RepID=A0AAN8I6E2_9EURO|nr:hypothetical protein OHC33_002250 [Knufia fluminis]
MPPNAFDDTFKSSDMILAYIINFTLFGCLFASRPFYMMTPKPEYQLCIDYETCYNAAHVAKLADLDRYEWKVVSSDFNRSAKFSTQHHIQSLAPCRKNPSQTSKSNRRSRHNVRRNLRQRRPAYPSFPYEYLPMELRLRVLEYFLAAYRASTSANRTITTKAMCKDEEDTVLFISDGDLPTSHTCTHIRIYAPEEVSRLFVNRLFLCEALSVLMKTTIMDLTSLDPVQILYDMSSSSKDSLLKTVFKLMLTHTYRLQLHVAAIDTNIAYLPSLAVLTGRLQRIDVYCEVQLAWIQTSTGLSFLDYNELGTFWDYTTAMLYLVDEDDLIRCAGNRQYPAHLEQCLHRSLFNQPKFRTLQLFGERLEEEGRSVVIRLSIIVYCEVMDWAHPLGTFGGLGRRAVRMLLVVEVRSCQLVVLQLDCEDDFLHFAHGHLKPLPSYIAW